LNNNTSYREIDAINDVNKEIKDVRTKINLYNNANSKYKLADDYNDQAETNIRGINLYIKLINESLNPNLINRVFGTIKKDLSNDTEKLITETSQLTDITTKIEAMSNELNGDNARNDAAIEVMVAIRKFSMVAIAVVDKLIDKNESQDIIFNTLIKDNIKSKVNGYPDYQLDIEPSLVKYVYQLIFVISNIGKLPEAITQLESLKLKLTQDDKLPVNLEEVYNFKKLFVNDLYNDTPLRENSYLLTLDQNTSDIFNFIYNKINDKLKLTKNITSITKQDTNIVIDTTPIVNFHHPGAQGWSGSNVP